MMMYNDRNIDRLFQEEAANYRPNPPENTWRDLDRRLHKKKSLLRVISPIFKIAAIVVLISFSAAYLYMHQVNTSQVETLQRLDIDNNMFSQLKTHNLYKIYLTAGQKPPTYK